MLEGILKLAVVTDLFPLQLQYAWQLGMYRLNFEIYLHGRWDVQVSLNRVLRQVIQWLYLRLPVFIIQLSEHENVKIKKNCKCINYFISIHICLGSRSSLPNNKWKVFII